MEERLLKYIVGHMEYGYLYEDITDNGDGIYQLTEEGEELIDFIEQELDKARECGKKEKYMEIKDKVDEMINQDKGEHWIGSSFKMGIVAVKEELSKLKE